MRIVLLLCVVMVIVLFLAAFVAPRRSRRLQRWFSRVMRRGQGKGDRNAGRIGDATETTLDGVRRLGEASGDKGRELREKLPR